MTEKNRHKLLIKKKSSARSMQIHVSQVIFKLLCVINQFEAISVLTQSKSLSI